jgi:hypothetical protein
MSVGIFCNELQRETKRMRNQIGHLKTMVWSEKEDMDLIRIPEKNERIELKKYSK